MMVSGKRCRAGWLALLVVTVLSRGVVARAETRVNPTATDLRMAAERFDEGRLAFKAGAFAEAAEQFEAADSRAPSAAALGLAMRSRAESGQPPRAATLAELVLRRHADDGELVERAKAIILSTTPETGRITVDCEPACELVVDNKLIHGKSTEHWVVYVEPGEHAVAANWPKDRVAREQVVAVAGAAYSLSFKPAVAEPAEPVVIAAKPKVVANATSSTSTTAPSQLRSFPPVVFWVGVGTTAALGGAAIWSGLDTLNSPGTDAIRRECVGQGESCSLYREGQNKELRTNILFGVSAAFAIATALTGIFFTDFSPVGPAREAGAARIRVRPWLVALPELSARGTVGRTSLSTVVGAEGRF